MRRQPTELAGMVYICPMGELEVVMQQAAPRVVVSRRSGGVEQLQLAAAPPDLFERALRLQRDLAHYHGMWHRIPIPDLLIAETALVHNLGVVDVDGDFDRIREVRPLTVRRLV